jgi:hypothetical protein
MASERPGTVISLMYAWSNASFVRKPSSSASDPIRQKFKNTEVPCIVLAHLTPAQRRAYVLADNKLALNAGWDLEMLSLEIGELPSRRFTRYRRVWPTVSQERLRRKIAGQN